MSRPGAPSGEPSGIKEKPEPRRKIPIARSLNRLHSEEFWKVFLGAFDGELEHYTVSERPTLTNANPSALHLCKNWDTPWKHQPKRNIHGQDDGPRVSRGLGVLHFCSCPWRVYTPPFEYGELRRHLL